MKSRLMRVPDNFLKELDKIRNERIKRNIDSRPIERTSLLRKIPEHLWWSKIRDDTILEPSHKFRNKNRKGGFLSMIQMISLIAVICIVAFIVVVISGIWSFGFGQITDAIKSVPSEDNITNISYYGGEVVFGNINAGFSQLEWFSYMIIFGMFLGFIIGAFVVREHPGYLVIYVLASLVLVVFAIFISRAYNALYDSDSVIGTQLQSYTGASWMMLYLPVWVTVTAIVGAIVMFVIWNRDPDGGMIG